MENGLTIIEGAKAMDRESVGIDRGNQRLQTRIGGISSNDPIHIK